MAGNAGLTASPGLASRADPSPAPALNERRMADAVRAIAVDPSGGARTGQGGARLRMADAATVLWTRYLRFDAADPRWPDRDRFVLSSGCSAALLDALLHLTGAEGIGTDQLRHLSGLPLVAGTEGQVLATAVGMALAERMLAARFGRSLVDHRTWVIAASGDLTEGLSHEAVALAGTLRLDKLTCLYEEDREGSEPNTACSTDQLRWFASHGWAVKQVDGHDPLEIGGAMSFAVRSKKPTLIACRTREREQDADPLRASAGDAFPFSVTQSLADRWQAAGRRGAGARRAWLKRLARHPLRAEFERVMAGRLPETWHEGLAALKAQLTETRPVLATHQASLRVAETLVPTMPELIGGSSVPDQDEGAVRGLGQLSPDFLGGRYIRFGVCEHGMAAAFNGLAVHGGLIPYGVARLALTDYMRPALRLGALMGQRVVHLLTTHDGVGVAGDGPPWSPVEHLASLRAMPGVFVFRPADAVETAECWELAIRRSDGPSLLILSGQALPALRSDAGENRCARGGYVLAEADGARQATLIATGSEVSVAMAARELLANEGVAVAVVSLPCWELFGLQDKAMRAQVLGGVPRIGVEAASGFGWDRWLGEDGLFIGADGLAAPAPGRECGRHLGITPDAVAASVRKRLVNIVPDIHLGSEGSRE